MKKIIFYLIIGFWLLSIIGCAHKHYVKGVGKQNKILVMSNSLYVVGRLNEIINNDSTGRLGDLFPKPALSDLKNIKLVPLKGYVLDWDNYKGENEKLDRFLVVDSNFLGIMGFYKDSIIGFTQFHKINGYWKNLRIINCEDKKSPFFATYFMCQNFSKDVYTIRYNKSTSYHTWGFYNNGKLNIIKYSYGKIAHYTDFDKWANSIKPPKRDSLK